MSIASSSVILNASAQDDTQIPDWIKNVAGWWATDEISEKEFLDGIGYLINNNIISLDFIPCSTQVQDSSEDTRVPDWVKNNAEWWSDGLI